MSRRMPSFAARTFTFGAILSLIAAAPLAAQTVQMKIGTATVNDVQHEWMKRYKERVEKSSGGRINVKLYTAGQLGSIPRQIEGVQLGTQEGNVVPPAFFVGVDPRFQVLDAPGLFESSDHLLRTLADPAFRSKFLALGEPKGLKGISIFFVAPTVVVTRDPIRTLADFRGRKIRVFASPMQTLPFQRLDAAPVPMSLGEVLPALQRRVIDGVFGSVAIFLPFKYYNTAKYMTRTRWSYVVSMTVVGKRWFDALPKDLQTIVMREAAAIEPEVNAWSLAFFAKAEKAWKANGGELIELPPAQHAEMMKRLSGVAAEVLKQQPALSEIHNLMLKAAGIRH